MLKYKFKTYYPRSVATENLLNVEDYFGSTQLYTSQIFNNINFWQINLTYCIQIFNPKYTDDQNFNTLIRHLNRKDTNAINNIRIGSVIIDQLFIGLTNSMFLKELEKHKELLKPKVYIRKRDRLINFNVPIGAIGTRLDISSFESSMINGEYCNSIDFKTGVQTNMQYYKHLWIIIEKDKVSLDDYEELIFLYLKCALICAKKTYEYENLVGCLLSKISAPKEPYLWMNSIKKVGSINLYSLKLRTIDFYSKNKINENIYLSLNKGYFISNFNTYSNLKSFERNDTLIGMISEYYEDKTIKYKIIISSHLLDYFAFLKKNKKDELYTEDYNKLNKVLNAIKSIAIMKNLEIEFGNIEQDIYNIELTITNNDLEKILSSHNFDLIPKNINQAKELKGIYEDLLSQIKYSREISEKYLFSPGSIFSPLSGATMAEMEDELIRDELPF